MYRYANVPCKIYNYLWVKKYQKKKKDLLPVPLYFKSGSIIQAPRDFKRIYSAKKCLSRYIIISFDKENKS
jgi:hypothetical protein